MKLPYWIECVDKVPVLRVQKEEFGFRTLESGVNSTYIGADEIDKVGEPLRSQLRKEYLTLTGDLNMVDMEWIAQYQIKDPVAYLFNVREQKETIRDANMVVMKKIMGDNSVDEAITLGRVENEIKAKEELQTLLDQYDTGIKVVAVKLQSINPPRPVRSSFNDVSNAMQEKETSINNARKKYNEIIPEARGKAQATIKEASGYAIDRTNSAQGDASRFLQVLGAYTSFPQVTEKRLYYETFEELLPLVKEKTIIDEEGLKNGFFLKLEVDQPGAQHE